MYDSKFIKNFKTCKIDEIPNETTCNLIYGVIKYINRTNAWSFTAWGELEDRYPEIISNCSKMTTIEHLKTLCPQCFI